MSTRRFFRCFACLDCARHEPVSPLPHSRADEGEDTALLTVRADDRDDGNVAGSVDVVIPLRNGASTIVSTLTSVVAQTLQPRRVIVVDDGSSDGGAALVMGHPMVDVITTPHRGVSHARNTGIKAARAEYVAFLDCDDLWRTDKLERQMAIFNARPEVSVVSCDRIIVRANGDAVSGTLSAPRFRGRVFNDILERSFAIGGWSSGMVVRRTSLLLSGGFDEQLQFSEDLEVCLRLAHDHVFDFCPEVLTYIVENPGSTTRRPSDPRRNLETSLQGLSVIERWVGIVEISPRVTGRCRQYILSRYLRRRLGCSRLVDFRTEMELRTPKLARLIARSDAHFIWGLGLCCVPRSPEILTVVWRQMARAGPWPRPAGISRVPVAQGLRAKD